MKNTNESVIQTSNHHDESPCPFHLTKHTMIRCVWLLHMSMVSQFDISFLSAWIHENQFQSVCDYVKKPVYFPVGNCITDDHWYSAMVTVAAPYCCLPHLNTRKKDVFVFLGRRLSSWKLHCSWLLCKLSQMHRTLHLHKENIE